MAIQLLLLAALVLSPAANASASDITVGILSHRPKPETEARFAPLKKRLAQALPDHQVHLRVYTYPELEAALAARSLDFVLTNPGHYIQLRHLNGMSGVLATLVEQKNGRNIPAFGGVIVTKNDRQDINRLHDLNGKRIAIVGTGSLGGYQAQAYELQQAGVRLPHDATLVITGMPHDLTVQALLEGRADAAMIRTGDIEEMVSEGKLDPNRLKVLNRQQTDGLPFVSSTRLYPQWPFVALPHVDERMARKTASTLLGMEPIEYAAGSFGFTIPADYTSVENLLRELRLPPFEKTPAFTLHDIVQRYRWQLIAFLLAAGIILLLGVRLFIINKKLAASEVSSRENERYLRTILETEPECIKLLDADCRVLMMNRAGLAMIEADSFEQIKGQPAYDLVAVSHREAFAALTRQVFAGAPGTLEFEACGFKGRHVWLETHAVPLRNEAGDVVSLLGITRDITEQKQAKDELIKAKCAAEAANIAKSEFLANMSHEIRTPMNGVIGMAQLLRFTELTDEQQEYLTNIETSSENLLSIINDILDLSKIEAGKVELEYADFSLQRCISDVVAMHSTRIVEKGLRYESQISPKLPRVVCGDQLRVKQILLNLLSNAIKFTEKGQLTIDTELLEHQQDQIVVQITIADTGIGMPPNALQKVFEPFIQADASTTRKFGGTGLGLAICRQLAELMGGRIWATSEEGVGSQFHLELPFTLPTPSTEAVSRAQTVFDATLPTTTPLTILTADDNPLNLRSAELILQKLGHRAIRAENGQTAVEKWQENHIDLILMDIQMPVVNGIEALHLIRAKEREQGNTQVPVIALTADALKGTEERLLNEGFTGYLTKPFKVEVLAETIQKVTANQPDRAV